MQMVCGAEATPAGRLAKLPLEQNYFSPPIGYCSVTQVRRALAVERLVFELHLSLPAESVPRDDQRFRELANVPFAFHVRREKT